MKIFVIGGKARQGKDTFCSMIRSYYKQKGIKTINLQFSSKPINGGVIRNGVNFMESTSLGTFSDHSSTISFM